MCCEDYLILTSRIFLHGNDNYHKETVKLYKYLP